MPFGRMYLRSGWLGSAMVLLGVGVDFFRVGFGGNRHNGRLISPHGQVPINRVVAQIELAICKPASKWRAGVVAALLGLAVPVDGLCLFEPEGIACFGGYGSAVKICERGHLVASLR